MFGSFFVHLLFAVVIIGCIYLLSSVLAVTERNKSAMNESHTINGHKILTLFKQITSAKLPGLTIVNKQVPLAKYLYQLFPHFYKCGLT